MNRIETAPQCMPRTVAITGAMGFVASHLMPRLAAEGVRILAVVRPGRDVSALPQLTGIEVRHGELSEHNTLARTFEGADAVVHLAGLALVPVTLPAVLAAGVLKGVVVSSAGVYTHLKSSGADAKRLGEAALRDSPLAFTILRPSMIYGTPRDRNMIRLLRWIQRWPWVPAPLGGITPQQPVHVDDLVQVIIASLARPIAARREYDVGGPEPIPLAEVIHTAASALERRVGILPVPLAPAHAAAMFASRINLPFPVSPEQVMRLTESKAVDISPARAELDFAPRTFREGISAEALMLRP